MIEVNLLPQEFRVAETTPLPRLLAILAGVAIVSLELVFVIMLVGQVRKNQEAVARMKKNVKQAQAEVQALNDIKAKNESLIKQEITVAKLLRNRPIWYPILERFRHVTPPRVWITRFDYRRTKGLGTLALECRVSGSTGKTGTDLNHELTSLMSQFWMNVQNDEGEGDSFGLADIFALPRNSGLEIRDAPFANDLEQLSIPPRVGHFKIEMDFDRYPAMN